MSVAIPTIEPSTYARAVAAARREALAAAHFACHALTDDDVHICTRPFGHDGDHVAHGPHGEAARTWERRATDRDPADFPREA